MPDTESKAGHRPGPWHAVERSEEVRDARGRIVARACGPYPRYLADAAFIAAAPETRRQRDMLLAELKRYHASAVEAMAELLEGPHGGTEFVRAGQAALDKTAALISACEESPDA